MVNGQLPLGMLEAKSGPDSLAIRQNELSYTVCIYIIYSPKVTLQFLLLNIFIPVSIG